MVTWWFGSVCLQNPLDSSVDLLPVGRNGLTGLEPEKSRWAEALIRKDHTVIESNKTVHISKTPSLLSTSLCCNLR